MQSSADWLAYFERNRERRLLIPWERGIAVEAQLRAPLVHSLRRFQVGEQGDGRHLRQAAAATGDSDYAAAISLFVQEEQEHARMLAGLIHGMGGSLMRWHWSDACFVALRRLSGLRLELMVLLIAEMIARAYYRALYDGTRDVVLRMAFAQILRDEVGHVTFHCDTLQRAFQPHSPAARRLVRRLWRILYRCVCLVVIVDHRPVLRAARASPRAFWRECGQIFEDISARIFGLRPAVEHQQAHIKID